MPGGNEKSARFGPKREESLGALDAMVETGVRHANINGRFDATIPFVRFLRVLQHLGLLRSFLDNGELQATLLGQAVHSFSGDHGVRHELCARKEVHAPLQGLQKLRWDPRGRLDQLLGYQIGLGLRQL